MRRLVNIFFTYFTPHTSFKELLFILTFLRVYHCLLVTKNILPMEQKSVTEPKKGLHLFYRWLNMLLLQSDWLAWAVFSYNKETAVKKWVHLYRGM